jgi:hypothetical protein
MKTYAEKCELIFQAYKKSFDLEVALVTSQVGLTPGERASLSNDVEFQARLDLADALLKETLVQNLSNIARLSAQDGVKLSANKDLGRMFYPKRFKDVDPPAPSVNMYQGLDLSKLTDDELLQMRALMSKAQGG